MNEPLLPLHDDTDPMPTADTAAPATAASAVTPLRARARRRVVGLEARSRRQKGIRYVFLAVSAAFMINAVVGDNGLLASMKAKRQSQEMQAALNALRVENQQLRNRANRLKNDPTAIEEEARKNLGLIRPGETLVIVKDAPASK